MRQEKTDGSWNKFPKHEQVTLEKTLYKIEVVYGGVSELSKLPDVVFIVDIKKEIACLREAVKYGLTTVAIVDTNSDPTLVDYPIPANDDAVGSIKFIADCLTDAYIEGKKTVEKKEKKGKEIKVEQVEKVEQEKQVEKEEKKLEKKEPSGKEEKKKKRGRPKKVLLS
jgi:small subunit ribosomal protein S2